MILLGKVLFRIRNWFFPVLWLLMLVGLQPYLVLGDPRWDLVADLAGFAVILAGLAVRFAVIGLVNIPREGKKKTVHAKGLATSGLFRHVRNPLYVGNVTIFAGWLVILNNPWGYLAGLPVALIAYQAIIRAEEAFMVDRFGEEFARYTEEVNRWVPRLKGLRASLREHSFNWGRAVAKEYNAILLWTTMALVAMADERLVNTGLPLTPAFALAAGLTLGTVAGISGFIIFLKRKKILSGRGWLTETPRT